MSIGRFHGTARYLHYFAANAEDDIRAANSELAGIKADIKQRVLNQLEVDAVRSFFRMSDLGYDPKTAEDLFSGKLFTEALQDFQTTKMHQNKNNLGYSVRATLEELVVNGGEQSKKLAKLEEDINAEINACIDTIEDYIGNLGIQKSVINDIISNIIESNRQKKGEHNSTISKRILNRMMDATERGKYFKYNYESKGFTDVRRDLTELLSAIYALLQQPIGDNAAFLSTNRLRRHGSGKVETQTIKEGIMDLMEKWRMGLDRQLYETADIQCALEASQQAQRGIMDFQVMSFANKRHGVDIDFRGDKRLESVFKKAEAANSQLYSATNKADSNVVITNSATGLSATYYISAKKHDEMKVDGNIIQSMEFNAVSGTPLSALFIRDTKLGYDFLHNFIQVGTVHWVDESDHAGSWKKTKLELYHTNLNLNSIFNNMVDVIKTDALYGVLMGERAGKGLMIMRLGGGGNDKFVSVAQVLREALNGKNVTTGMVIAEGPQLARDTFVKINKWKKGDDWIRAALDRSAQTEIGAVNLMHQIKVSIKFNLNNFNIGY